MSESNFPKISFISNWFNEKFSEFRIFLGKVDDTHFVMVSPIIIQPELSQSSPEQIDLTDDSFDLEAIYDHFAGSFPSEEEFVRQWLAERKGKWFHLDYYNCVTYENEDIYINGCFRIADFFHKSLSTNLSPVLVQMMDPLKRWADDKLPIISEFLDVSTIVCLRPSTWLNSRVITEFVNYINENKTAKDRYFIDTMTPEECFISGRDDSAKLLKTLEEIRKHETIVFALHVTTNHFVTLEVNRSQYEKMIKRIRKLSLILQIA